MKLFNKIAYHSTKQKGLKEFQSTTDETKAFKGEGAMVHGWGLYLQSDKELNIDRYKNRLGEMNIRYCVDGKDIEDSYPDLGMLQRLYDKSNDYGNLQNYVENLERDLSPSYMHSETYIKTVKAELDYIKRNNVRSSEFGGILYFTRDGEEHEFESYYVSEASQYEVEIPDDMVFVGETDKIDVNHPLYNIFNDIWNKYHNSDLWEELRNTVTYDVVEADIKNRSDDSIGLILKSYNISTNVVPEIRALCRKYYQIKDVKYEGHQFDDDFMILYDEITDCLFEQMKVDGNMKSLPETSFKAFYTWIKGVTSEQKASIVLMNNGIDGIKYNGDLDGECYVIFNCSKLHIISEG